jgi:DNA gyrase/topoisomerase IV subunit B
MQKIHFYSRSHLFYRTRVLSPYNSSQIWKLYASTKAAAEAEENIAKYERKTPIEHILLRPGMYVGQMEIDKKETWVFNEVEKKMVKKQISYSPALLKIFDEILVNAADNRHRDKKMSKIDVSITRSGDELSISVQNDGIGLPVSLHPKEKIYIPELVFGNLLTGSNFNDKEVSLIDLLLHGRFRS